MKKILFAAIIFAFASCTKKSADVQFDPNKQYFMKYKTDNQIVKTRVTNDTLRLDFYQNIVLLVDPYEYSHTWALDLIQDFSHSYLNNLHFDAVASAAGYAHDWVPINLNDAAPGQKTATNVTVDGKKYVQVTIVRKFEFYSPLGSHEAALSKQNQLLQTTSDYVTYKAFYSFDNIYSVSNDANINIVYQ